MAFLKLVEIGDSLARQIGEELKTAFGGNAAPIGALLGVTAFSLFASIPRSHQTD